jgi:ubiquinone/menaquinone biosynthesis C-methylase UbiE
LVARGAGFCDLRDRIIELAEPLAEHTIVDVGSGTGLLSLALAEARRVLKPDGRLVMGDMMFSLNPIQTRDAARLLAHEGGIAIGETPVTNASIQ